MFGIQHDPPGKSFAGVRFALFGFDPIAAQKVREKLVGDGGVDVGQHVTNCTHVIVHKHLIYDDPICVAARSNGKTLVTYLWVDHSYDTGNPVDATDVIYRPVRDLGGIPGAKSFVVCLTGYQGQQREDIMTMVNLMGACFSKPLEAQKVTHLICYKFEGEKYKVARKWEKIKLVNHHWLKDCLRAWEILPEGNYNKSGCELENMEPETRDSEGGQAITRKQFEAREMDVSPCGLLEETLTALTSFHLGKQVVVASHGSLLAATENTIPNQDSHGKKPQGKYGPRRGFGGIPGAKSLVVCSTGYPRRDRDDIMKMVGRMRAKFLGPLTKKVTHLICYKFEGDKYKVARKWQKIKLVNHHWLKDCLRAWEILPEENYSMSGYELETMEVEAKDAERAQAIAKEINFWKNWEIRPEENFNKSRYELETMEVEAKDSERAQAAIGRKHYKEINLLKDWEVLPEENCNNSGHELDTIEVETKYSGVEAIIARQQYKERVFEGMESSSGRK